jgi:nucleotide-binding universal stress UspA family protein
MFKKILVCLDGSALAEKVLPFAIDEARQHEALLFLYRVIPEPSLVSLGLPGMPAVPVETGGMKKQVEEMEKEAEAYLAALADLIENENDISVDFEASLGDAGPSIVEFADDNQVDLIMIATHGRSGAGRVVMGSVADHVIRHTRLPVLLIRPG